MRHTASQLRNKYQHAASKAILDALKKTGKALIYMATGLGKTRVAARITKELIGGGRCLFLGHMNSGLEQAMSEFKKVLGSRVTMGLFHGEKKCFAKVDVLFASFQTMVKWKHTFTKEQFPNIIVDESHHGCARTFEGVLDYFRPTTITGMTATPERMDGRDICRIFGPATVNIPLDKAIAMGYLAEIEYHLVTDGLRYRKFRKIIGRTIKNKKRLSMRQLNRKIFIRSRDEKVAETIESFGDKKTIVFCQCIRHADNFRKFLPGSEVYHSGINPSKNSETLRSFRTGRCRRIITVDKMNECIDVPDVGLIVFLRCTDSKTVFLHQLGRGLRKTSGKRKVVVLDFVANADRITTVHGLAKKIINLIGKQQPHDHSTFFVKGLFNFVFTDEQIDLSDVLGRLERKFISDIPRLASEYSGDNPLPANEVPAGTHEKLWWKCSKCGWKWKVSGNGRYIHKRGCPSCANKVVTPFNNMAITHPLLAMEISPKNPFQARDIVAGTNRKILWKCSGCGFEWTARGSSRAGQGNGCPACASNHKATTDKNNFAAVYPTIAKEYSSRNRHAANTIVAGGSSKKFWWKCVRNPNHHEWQSRIHDRVNGHGCPMCWDERRRLKKNK